MIKLPNASSPRGAAMGRPNILPTNRGVNIKLRMERLRWVDGDYDSGGAYWGGGRGFIYCAQGERDGEDLAVEVFTRAGTRAEAKANVREILPNARFYN